MAMVKIAVVITAYWVVLLVHLLVSVMIIYEKGKKPSNLMVLQQNNF